PTPLPGNQPALPAGARDRTPRQPGRPGRAAPSSAKAAPGRCGRRARWEMAPAFPPGVQFLLASVLPSVPPSAPARPKRCHRSGPGQRQLALKTGSLAKLAEGADLPAMAQNDAPAKRKPQPNSLADRPHREERLEDVANLVLRNSTAGVGDRHHQVVLDSL